MNILITGCAGFIGFNLCNRILNEKKTYKIYGIDNLNNYYDVKLKKNRLNILKKYKKFYFDKINISQKKKLSSFFRKNKFDIVIHLAAQAGVRYSITNPDVYLESNIIGFFNLIENAKSQKIKHFIYASTSSVYGDSKKFPIKENFNTDKPLSFYAASKKCNEIIAHSFSAIYKLPTTGLRFFTVYGPYGRPDMSLFKFTKNILSNKKIDLYNNGNHIRDFTYIDDITSYIIKIINKIPRGRIPYSVFNLGSNNPKHLKNFISIIEKNLSKKAKINKLKLQVGDVHKTHADNKKIKEITKIKKNTTIFSGIEKFIEWYKTYYNQK